jgi:hypothetical protein
MDELSQDESRAGRGFADTVLLVGAIGLIAWPAISGIARVWRVRNPAARTDPLIDKTLKDSFPASDPPASTYFDIPENRR